MKLKKLNRVNVGFFSITTAVALIGGPAYLWIYGLTWVAALTFLGMFTLTMMSISTGYHRLYAHRTHDAAPWLQFFYLVFGAAAFEQSCMKWATEHRIHHRYVDTDKDPYNIKQGFWWAHIGWILHEDPGELEAPNDLQSMPLVVWQQRNWILIAILTCFGLPTLVGALFGDPLGGFLFGGVVRLVAAHQCTFMINSLAHYIGSQPYSDKTTARDSWITALFTMGEGYHNFHHWKPGDYRNGNRLFHWDPPKWFIAAMSWVGQSWNLQRTSEEAIVRAKVEMQRQRIEAKGIKWSVRMEERFQGFMIEVDELSKRRREWVEAKRNASSQAVRHEMEHFKQRFKEAKNRYRDSYKEWRLLHRRAGSPSFTA